MPDAPAGRDVLRCCGRPGQQLWKLTTAQGLLLIAPASLGLGRYHARDRSAAQQQ